MVDGDGGSAKDLLKHNTIETIKLVEMDEAVPELRTYLRGIHFGVLDETVSAPLSVGQWMMACAIQTIDLALLDAKQVDTVFALRGQQYLQPYNGHTHRSARALPYFCLQAGSGCCFVGGITEPQSAVSKVDLCLFHILPALGWTSCCASCTAQPPLKTVFKLTA